MFKNIQFKIILIFFLVGIAIIGGLGATFIYAINMINQTIAANPGIEIGQVLEILNNVEQNTKLALIISATAFILIGVLIAIFLSKFVIFPINKLIKSAEKITEEETKEKKKSKGKKKSEMGSLENVFGMMTTELKEKLSEVSTQKNQIETILLHMTDGIIAFNMQGEVILINPAAKKLLSIRPEDATFDDIFGKFNLNINLDSGNVSFQQGRIHSSNNYVDINMSNERTFEELLEYMYNNLEGFGE